MSLTVIFQKELFSVAGISLGSVLEFFSTMRNRPASDAVALLSINWFILGTLSSRTLPVIAHMLAPSAIRIAVQLVHKDIFFPVSFSASDLGIPGIYLVHDFITVEEEKRLLAEVDNRQWRSLSKRRVQHYGYEFLYEVSRFLYLPTTTEYMTFCKLLHDYEIWIYNKICRLRLLQFYIPIVIMVHYFAGTDKKHDSKHFLGELPSFVSNILQKILSFPGLGRDQNKEMDQLTVNEYPCGVGLSPHIDTHSAFDELIFSLSTAGPCIMEFRRYPEGTWCHPTAFVNEIHEDTPLLSSYIIRKAIFLPPRSMILMSGEGRYAWHHYIPHRKVCLLLCTSLLVRKGPCCCPYKQYCDSQLECRNQQVKQNIVQSSLPLKREAFCPTDTDQI
ncbi:unnamed protein product [Musa hybrid cultivar]